VYPADEDLFDIDDAAPLLDKAKSKQFHSVVYEVFYASKRTYPDTLLPIQFLTSRVTKATTQDWKKLDKVIHYLAKPQETDGIILRPVRSPDGSFRVYEYADISFGVHVDGKSHTGAYVSLGGGPIHAKSTKQGLTTKSSAEAEFVGASDSVSQALWIRNYIAALDNNIAVEPAVVLFQDNTAAIQLMHNGMSNSERTRHINIRYFFLTDRIESGELWVTYVPTDQMIADVLTKALKGAKFFFFRAALHGVRM
jgi:hypothetical protein